LKPNSFNECLRIFHCVFDLAVADGVIAQSPLRPKQESQQIRRRRVRGTIRRPIPTPDQVAKIISEIRENPFSDHAVDSADFVEFMALSGLGQAEAGSLTWGDVFLEKDIHTESPSDKIFVERKKTKGQWAIPIYPALRPLLVRLRAHHHPSPSYDTPILRIKDAKKAVAAACRKLGIRHYEQRAFRRFFIASCIKRGVNPKTIARWQNHHDGGRLILETYSELFEEAYNTTQEDLNKLR
jgi:integrase